MREGTGEAQHDVLNEDTAYGSGGRITQSDDAAGTRQDASRHEAFVEVDLNNSRLRSMARGNDEFLDTVEGEITFFRSLMRARPVGLHKHFHALSMRTAIHQDTGHYVTLDAIWRKLNDLYNLKALEDLVRSCAYYIKGLRLTHNIGC